MNNLKEAAIIEAKSFLADINSAISNIRDRSWQLMAFVMAIDVYLFQSIVSITPTAELRTMFYISIPFSIYTYRCLYYALFPSKIVLNGSQPKMLDTIIDGGEDFFYKAIMKGIQKSIDINTGVLQKMTDKYKCALWSCIALIGSFAIFIFYVYISGISHYF